MDLQHRQERNLMEKFFIGFFQEMSEKFTITKSYIVGMLGGLYYFFRGLNFTITDVETNFIFIVYAFTVFKAMVAAGDCTLATKMVGYAWENRKKYFAKVKRKIKRKKP